ncbi:MAG: hypothetical protein LBD72_02700 [Puniceicoccales bacterium]|jgi:hypothetical protein|nr:hypothetical protein [Puniceicoccales bacterium]
MSTLGISCSLLTPQGIQAAGTFAQDFFNSMPPALSPDAREWVATLTYGSNPQFTAPNFVCGLQYPYYCAQIVNEQVVKNLRECPHLYNQEDRLRLLMVLFPSGNTTSLQNAAKKSATTIEFIIQGLSTLYRILADSAMDHLGLASTQGELAIRLGYIQEHLFWASGFAYIPQRIFLEYRQRCLTFFVQNLVGERHFPFIGYGRDSVQIPYCADPYLSLTLLTNFAIEVYVNDADNNALNAIVFLLRIGIVLRRNSPTPAANAPLLPVDPKQLHEGLSLYPADMRVNILRSFASANFAVSVHALLASISCRVIFHQPFWCALALEQIFPIYVGENFDLKALVRDWHCNPPQTGLEELMVAIAHFGDGRQQLRALQNLTFFKDLRREPQIEIKVGDNTYKDFHNIKRSDINPMIANAEEYPQGPLGAIALMGDILLQNLPLDMARNALLAVIQYPWTQGECARLLLIIQERWNASELVFHLFALLNAGRNETKISLIFAPDGSVVIQSTAAYGGPLAPGFLPPDMPGHSRAPFIFLFTEIGCKPNGQIAVHKAQMAFRV